MTKEQATAVFVLADIPVLKMWELPNGYWPRPSLDVEGHELNDALRYHRLREASPWWLVRTPFGLVEIGPRKRVIAIDWSDTPVRAEVTADDVTKGTTHVHAWSTEDAVRYLKALAREAGKFRPATTEAHVAAAGLACGTEDGGDEKEDGR
jgi:hypothetical protein